MNRIQYFAKILTIGNGILLPIAITIFCIDYASNFTEASMDAIIHTTLRFTIPLTIGTLLLFFYARQWHQPRRHAWMGWLLSTMYNAYAIVVWWMLVAWSMGIFALPVALWVTLTCSLSALALAMGDPNQKVQHNVVYRNLRKNTARALLFALLVSLLYYFLTDFIHSAKHPSISVFESAYMAIGEVGLLIFFSEIRLLFFTVVLLHLREWFRPSARFAFLHWFIVTLLHSSLAFIYLRNSYTLILGMIGAAMALSAFIPFVMLLCQGLRRQPKEVT